MDYSFRLHTKHYYRVVKAREAANLPVDKSYNKMVDTAVLIRKNPDIFERNTNLVGTLIGKLKFIL